MPGTHSITEYPSSFIWLLKKHKVFKREKRIIIFLALVILTLFIVSWSLYLFLRIWVIRSYWLSQNSFVPTTSFMLPNTLHFDILQLNNTVYAYCFIHCFFNSLRGRCSFGILYYIITWEREREWNRENSYKWCHLLSASEDLL